METKFPLGISLNDVKTVVMIFVMIIVGIVIYFYVSGLGLIDDPQANSMINNTTGWFILAITVIGIVVVILILMYLFKAFDSKK